jgi:NAD(P)H-hydrate epimerase
MNSRLIDIIVEDISNRAVNSDITDPGNARVSPVTCVTCAEMKAIEKAADAAGLSYYQMMENAGTLTTELILAELSTADWIPAYDVVFDLKPQVLVFCGKGNNGGDGFVVARKLSQQGFPVSVILVEGTPTTPDAISNDRLLPKAVERISVQTFLETRLDAFPMAFSGIIVDAIYGTGFHGELQAKVAKVIEWINHTSLQRNDPHASGPHHSGTRNAGKLVVSLDLPSGLSGDMKADDLLPALCVQADRTIVFHQLKPVHLSIAAQPFLGKITLADIGISAVLK